MTGIESKDPQITIQPRKVNAAKLSNDALVIVVPRKEQVAMYDYAVKVLCKALDVQMEKREIVKMGKAHRVPKRFRDDKRGRRLRAEARAQQNPVPMLVREPKGERPVERISPRELFRRTHALELSAAVKRVDSLMRSHRELDHCSVIYRPNANKEGFTLEVTPGILVTTDESVMVLPVGRREIGLNGLTVVDKAVAAFAYKADVMRPAPVVNFPSRSNLISQARHALGTAREMFAANRDIGGVVTFVAVEGTPAAPIVFEVWAGEFTDIEAPGPSVTLGRSDVNGFLMDRTLKKIIDPIVEQLGRRKGAVPEPPEEHFAPELNGFGKSDTHRGPRRDFAPDDVVGFVEESVMPPGTGATFGRALELGFQRPARSGDQPALA